MIGQVFHIGGVNLSHLPLLNQPYLLSLFIQNSSLFQKKCLRAPE